MSNTKIYKQIIGLCEEIQKPKTLEMMKSMLTDSQSEFYDRIFDKAVPAVKTDDAINLCVRTLRKGNDDIEKLQNASREFEANLKTEKETTRSLTAQLNQAKRENEKLTAKIEATPMTKEELESEYVANRLAILDALEAGGVDNWDWYGESLEQAGL
jgi:septal ring factor EnvC (AmiA/AmiB activator)